MRIPFFASFIVFIIWLAYEISKSKKIEKKSLETYQERELRANSTRKKSLDSLCYIEVPSDLLSIVQANQEESISSLVTTLVQLAQEKIVNLNGLSNTDLKLMYGVPNLPILTTLSQNYTTLESTLQKLGDHFYRNNNVSLAKQCYEFALQTNTDISFTYKALATIYQEENNREAFQHLFNQANSLNSIMKNSIVRTLKEFDRYNDLPHSS